MINKQSKLKWKIRKYSMILKNLKLNPIPTNKF
jgi:hypothetical protein